MKTRIGLWIDHRKAVVVALARGGMETTVVIQSKVDRQPGRSGGKQSTTPYEPQLVSADDRRQKRFTGQLDIYYDAVIACVRKAEAILIFGPGEAKGEFRKRIKKAGFCGRIEETETFGQMTDRQIAAHVRRYFQSIPDKLRAKGQKDQAVGHVKQAAENGVRQVKAAAQRIVDNAAR